MASSSKKIKGINIEIGGNTTKLKEALKDVDNVVYHTNTELSELKKALKLDPGNATLLSQKYELLKKNIEATKNRLDTLKEAQKQMGNYNNLTDEQKESYRALTVEISKVEKALEGMNKELHASGKIDLSKIGTALEKIGNVALDVSKKMAQVSAAIGGALAGVVTAGVKSYASLEQNIGGVETLFKESEKEIQQWEEIYGKSWEELQKEGFTTTADQVISNASKAFETAGVSANEYMQGVTSFAASLLQSVEGNSWEAMEIADMAFIDMADNANKFGTDMASIQHAYQGFAKQNYTMLDNLKLGYGGTKTEMERLLSDAEKFSGIHYDISNLSDVYNAIHVIQEEMGVTGTTAKEASETISGSVASMKAAFDNFLNGSGSAKDVAKTVKNVIKNIVNAVTKIAPDILNGIVELTKELLPEISKVIFAMLPTLFESVTNMIQSILNLIQENKEPFADMVVNLLMMLVNFIIENLPLIIDVGLQIIIALATGIADKLPELIPTIVDTILYIVDILLEHIDVIIEAGAKLLAALALGLFDALPKLLVKIPEIIIKLRDGLREGIAKIRDVGAELIAGLWNGIQEKWNKLKEKVANFGKGIVDKFKNVFGIHSPSKVMKEQIGENLGLGIAEGVEDTFGNIENTMKALNYKVKTSINPIINPNAISQQLNPKSNSLSSANLFIDYDKLALAIASQFSKMKVVLDDEEVGNVIIDKVTNEIYN